MPFHTIEIIKYRRIGVSALTSTIDSAMSRRLPPKPPAAPLHVRWQRLRRRRFPFRVIRVGLYLQNDLRKINTTQYHEIHWKYCLR